MKTRNLILLPLLLLCGSFLRAQTLTATSIIGAWRLCGQETAPKDADLVLILRGDQKFSQVLRDDSQSFIWTVSGRWEIQGERLVLYPELAFDHQGHEKKGLRFRPTSFLLEPAQSVFFPGEQKPQSRELLRSDSGETRCFARLL